jgi:hypothetical protein
MRWRMIGPFRGGRTRAAAGVPNQPNVFYVGQVNGGVWKSDDYGRTWNPIFDHESTQSIGAIAVAASDPNIIYVSSGEGLHRPDLSVGNGIYKSTDAGKTWAHLGLIDGQQIPALAVDPRDPNKVFAAVLGHPYGPSEERGLYRSTDGGQNWQRVIAKDENTGASDVVIRRGRRTLQIHRRRQHVASADQRPAERSLADLCRDCSQRSAPPLRNSRRSFRKTERLPLRRRRRQLGKDHRRSPPLRAHRRRRSSHPEGGSKES